MLPGLVHFTGNRLTCHRLVNNPWVKDEKSKSLPEGVGVTEGFRGAVETPLAPMLLTPLIGATGLIVYMLQQKWWQQIQMIDIFAFISMKDLIYWSTQSCEKIDTSFKHAHQLLLLMCTLTASKKLHCLLDVHDSHSQSGTRKQHKRQHKR